MHLLDGAGTSAVVESFEGACFGSCTAIGGNGLGCMLSAETGKVRRGHDAVLDILSVLMRWD